VRCGNLIHGNLHEVRHFFSLYFRACQLQSLLTKKLFVDVVVQWTFFFEKLLVIQKVHGWEYPFEQVPPVVFLHGFFQAQLFLFRPLL